MDTMTIAMAVVLSVLPAAENQKGDPNAIGDLNIANHAVGIYQIRKPYLDDVNSLFRDEVVRTWGRLLTIDDMRDPAKSKWVVCKYLGKWGGRYQSETGREPTVEVYARIHNGGPNGWRKKSTDHYWDCHFKPQYDRYLSANATKKKGWK